MAENTSCGISDHELTLWQSARRFVRGAWPANRLHALVAASSHERNVTPRWDKGFWQQLVDMGWAGMRVPAELGGSELSWVAAVGVLEELGRAAAPSPLLPTLSATALLTACRTPAAEQLLRRIALGAAVTVGTPDTRHSAVEATADGVLSGSVSFVQDAQKCECVVLCARTSHGLAWYALELSDAGVQLVADDLVDLTRDQARLNLKQARATLLSAPAGGDPLWARIEPQWLMLLSADMVGAAEWQLQTTAEYAKTRVQFDKPIGAFQAVKHPLVDMMLAIDQARALLYRTARALDEGSSECQVLAHMLKASASEAAAMCSANSVQLHGGIGFTWECAVHVYFKRQKHSEVLWGNASHHRARVASLMF